MAINLRSQLRTKIVFQYFIYFLYLLQRYVHLRSRTAIEYIDEIGDNATEYAVLQTPEQAGY